MIKLGFQPKIDKKLNKNKKSKKNKKYLFFKCSKFLILIRNSIQQMETTISGINGPETKDTGKTKIEK